MSNEREDVRLITHVTYMVKKSCIQHRWPNGPPAAADGESRERLAGLLGNLLYLKKVQSWPTPELSISVGYNPDHRITILPTHWFCESLGYLSRYLCGASYSVLAVLNFDFNISGSVPPTIRNRVELA